MKIGIDVQTTLGEKTGFGFYVESLVKNIKKIDHKNKYILIRPKSENDLSATKRFIWDQFQVPRLAKKSQVEILHQPCFSAPIFHNHMKVVVTIHDVIAMLFGKDIPFFSRQYFGRWMPFSYQFVNRIICDSKHSKKDIIKFLKIPEEKITVTYLAADESLSIDRNNKRISEVKKKYKISGKYILNLSTINPRKNNKFLIKVFSNIAKAFKDYKLVITGKMGWYYDDLFKQVERLGLEKRVIFTGYINNKDKNALYNGAEIFTFPSIYEGFGFTVLEAMTCGIPVISSNASSLPEVVGDGGILLSPSDELSWTRHIKEILTNKVLRRRLVQKGLKQSAKFSWERTARETIAVYEDLYNS